MDKLLESMKLFADTFEEDEKGNIDVKKDLGFVLNVEEKGGDLKTIFADKDSTYVPNIDEIVDMANSILDYYKEKCKFPDYGKNFSESENVVYAIADNIDKLPETEGTKLLISEILIKYYEYINSHPFNIIRDKYFEFESDRICDLLDIIDDREMVYNIILLYPLADAELIGKRTSRFYYLTNIMYKYADVILDKYTDEEEDVDIFAIQELITKLFDYLYEYEDYIVLGLLEKLEIYLGLEKPSKRIWNIITNVLTAKLESLKLSEIESILLDFVDKKHDRDRRINILESTNPHDYCKIHTTVKNNKFLRQNI